MSEDRRQRPSPPADERREAAEKAERKRRRARSFAHLQAAQALRSGSRRKPDPPAR